MADNQHFYGFRWRRNMTQSGSGAPKPIRVRFASAFAPTANGNGVNLRVGDPVSLLSTGYAGVAVGSEGTQLGIYGILVGFGPRWDGAQMQFTDKYVSGTTYGTILDRESVGWVIPVQDQVFEIDCDDKVTATTRAGYLAFVGENCDHRLPSDTTNSADPKVDPYLDISSHATTNTLQWRIVDLSDRIDVDYSGSNVPLLVTCNRVQMAPHNTTGI